MGSNPIVIVNGMVAEMEDAPYIGHVWDAVTDTKVQCVEIEDYASLWVRFPLQSHRSSFRIALVCEVNFKT